MPGTHVQLPPIIITFLPSRTPSATASAMRPPSSATSATGSASFVSSRSIRACEKVSSPSTEE